MTLTRTAAWAALLPAITFASVAHATSIDYLANASGATSGWEATVQTFSVTQNSSLLTYSFVGATSTQGDYLFKLYDWTNDTLVYSAPSAISWIGGTNTITGINAALTAGHIYAAEVNYQGSTPGGVLFGGNVYPDGQGYWSGNPTGHIADYESFPELDTAFKIEFQAAAVPEPETYAMLLAGLGVLGVMGKRRKAG